MEPGTVIGGRYRIMRRIGSGGIASVYRATDELLREQVALKVLHPHLRDSPSVVEAFRREVTIGRMLEHPGAIRIHELGRDEATGAVYLSMEYLPGGDLRGRLLRLGRLEAGEVVSVAREVLGVLAAAHELGIVHRDLKPHNILLDGRGGCRLADFGLARCGALLGLDGGLHVAGTPEYLPPESAEAGYADARSDIYSLGVVLYELVCGRVPFRASSPYELLRMHAASAPRPPSELEPSVPAWLERAIERALEKDPARRFQTAGDFAAALSGESTVASAAPEPAHACPACGEPVPDGFPYCFSCRRSPLFLSSVGGSKRRGLERYRVVVTGPGKPGDQLGQELRHRCLALLRDAPVDASRLGRRLPRLPFVLLEDLDSESAGELVGELRSAGLGAEAAPARLSPERRRMQGLFLKKDALLAGRLFGIVAASSGGLFSGLGRVLTRGEAAIPILALLGFGLLAVPIVTAVRNRLPGARWRGGGWNRALRRYLTLAPSVTSAPLQALTRRIVLRMNDLRALAKPAPGSDIVAATEALVLQAADWIEACQALEEQLGDERGLYRRVEDLRGRGETADGGGVLVAAERSIDTRREAERSRDILLDRILAFSARLDRLWVSLGSSGARAAESEVRELSRAADEASAVIRAARETEDAASGREGAP